MAVETHADGATSRNEAFSHPLDPLDALELEAVVRVMRAAPFVDATTRFVSIELQEPSKEELRRFADGESIERRAFVVLLTPSTKTTTHEAVVSLASERIETSREVLGVQPAVTLDEYAECERTVRDDPAFRAALAKRGIAKTDLLTVEAWGIGDFTEPEDGDRRLVWTPCWIRSEPDDNAYACPVEGLYAIVDLNEMKVIRIEDHGVVPLPPTSGNYTHEAVGELRRDIRPLEIVQREGPSFEVNGWEIRWQKWSLRIGFTPREGLVLHTVSYRDGDRDRSILHRASFTELVVPYGDPSPGGYRKNAFDIGEYGLGPLTNSLELGCDCLGEIRYLDVHLADSHGQPYKISNAICLHEEDAGLLWKHFDAETGRSEVRRSRRFVVSFVITAGNYEYAFYWYLYQDGSIECEVKLTGIVLTSALLPGQTSRFGRVVAPQLNASNHQHFLNARLDFDVDGERNTVFEVHTERVPDEEDPHGNAFVAKQTPLRREADVNHLVDPLSARYWRIENPSVKNGLGQLVAYKLVPGGNVHVFAKPTSSIRRRAGFLDKHLWVTPFDPSQRFAPGDYPNQSASDSGLRAWTAANRSIEDTDVVIWYTFGSHHIPRPEDWPVMPVERVGFTLKPDGFFDRNPALDVPPNEQVNCHCHHHGEETPSLKEEEEGR